MPTVFVIQEQLTLSSALISFLGKGEERMHPSPSQVANAWTQSTKPEEVAILCLGGPSSMAQSPGIFPLGRRREGKMLTTATPRNVDFLLHHPLSIPGEL